MLAGLNTIQIAILAVMLIAAILTVFVSYHAVNVHNGRQGIALADVSFLASLPVVVMMIGLLVCIICGK